MASTPNLSNIDDVALEAEVAKRRVAKENERRAAALEALGPVAGAIGGEVFNEHIAITEAALPTLPADLAEQARHYLTCARNFGTRVAAVVAANQPLDPDAEPAAIPPQAP